MIEQYTDEQALRDAARMWNLSRLNYKLDDHQLTAYKLYRAWEKTALGIKTGAARVFVFDCGRQVGKTFTTCLIRLEDCLQRPLSRQTYATSFAKDISEIVIPNIETICEDAPGNFRPQYKGSKQGMQEGYYFPNGSILRLVGIDKNPNGLRGRTSDGFSISEAAFTKDLAHVVGSVIYPQFQRRKHARLIMESSAPEDPDHDFDTVFVPDAKRRKAYVFLTIDDNKSISEDDKREAIAAASTISHANMRREFFGERSRDFPTIVIPEFNVESHVRDVPVPQHGMGITVSDPGYRHHHGLVFGLYDYAESRIVIVDSWAKSNAGTIEVAAAMAAREHFHFGTWPHPRMARIPLDTTADFQGWRELLKRDTHEALADVLYEMAQTPVEARPDYESSPGKWIFQNVPDHLTWWNGVEYKTNPAERVSDVDLQQIRDMDDHHGLTMFPTTKTDLRSMVRLTRDWHAENRIVYLPTAGPVIDHVRVGKWAPDRKKFDEHKSFGHFDCLAGVNYLVRKVETWQNQDPRPPLIARIQRQPGVDMQERLPWTPKSPAEIEFDQRLAYAQGRTSRMKGYRD